MSETTSPEPAEAVAPESTEVAEPSPARSTHRRRGWGRTAPRRSIRLHRWLGWALGAFIVFETLTGSYLALADHLDVWTNGDRYRQTQGDVGPAAAAEAAGGAVDGSVAEVLFPGASDGVYRVLVRSQDGTEITSVYVDPGSGDVNDVVGPGRSFHTLVLELHRAFNRAEILGISTTNIVGCLGLVWFVVLVLGYRASRRHRRTLKQAARVRRRRGRFTFNLDLHKVLGLALVVPLVAIVLTGVALELRPGARAVVDALTPGHLRDEATFALPFSIPDGDQARLDLDTVVQRLDEAGYRDLQYVDIPVGNPAGTFVALVDQGGPAPYQADLGGGLTVYVDQYSGDVLATAGETDQSFGEQLYEGWVPAIHFGYFGRIWTQVLWALIGLLTLVLAVTAINMRRAKWAKRRTETQGDT